MKTQLRMVVGVGLGLGTFLQADYEAPGPGPDLNAASDREERPWTFALRTYVGYTDNVQILSDDNPFFSGSMESAYLGFTAEGSYRFWEEGNLDAGVAMRVDQTLHLKGANGSSDDGKWTDEPNNFDLTVVEPALYLNYRCEEGAVPVYGRLAYSFRWEDSRDTGIGLTTHNLGFLVGAEPCSDLHVELAYQHGWDDFDVSFTNPFSDRDAQRDRVSLSLIHPGSERVPRMILRYSYLNNDADGRNFEYDGSEVMFRVEAEERCGQVGGVAGYGCPHAAGRGVFRVRGPAERCGDLPVFSGEGPGQCHQ